LDALINAGGKGTRMGKCGVEKPMLTVGGKPTIQRVLEAVSASSHVDRVLVSVSDNTPGTERFLHRMGVETRSPPGRFHGGHPHFLREADLGVRPWSPPPTFRS
jgi:adenosylcobinamide-phosphate guanylyltransferase